MTQILNVLNMLLSMGGLWKNGKTVTGIVSLLLAMLAQMISQFAPEGFILQHLPADIVASLSQILAYIGFTLVPMGAVHKVVKTAQAAKLP